MTVNDTTGTDSTGLTQLLSDMAIDGEGSTTTNNQQLECDVEFEGFMGSKCNVLTRVPKGSRKQVCDALTKIVKATTRDTANMERWYDLLAFTRTCLKNPKRGGKKNINLTTTINRQTTSCTEGSWRSFNEEPVAKPRKKAGKVDNNKIVSRKINAGDVKGAVRLAASSDGLAPFNEETYQRLLKKHPSGPTPTPSQEPTPGPGQVTPQIVKKAIDSFPPGSAGGPDGLKPQILKDILHKSNGEAANNLLEELTRLVNKVLAGEVPAPLRRFFFGANLTALNKKDGGVRPIAVGNTFRRLTAKCAGALAMADRKENYGTTQLGYGVPMGCEAAVHSVRSYIENNSSPYKVLFKVDIENAFNSINRQKILDNTLLKHPYIYKFTESAYGQESTLFYNGRTIASAVGTQQGDPDGGPLFSDAINDTIQDVDSDLNVWFYDDGNIAGEYGNVLDNVNRLISGLTSLGLKVNTNKCELVFLGACPVRTKNHIHKLFQDACTGVRITELEELIILGSPVGEKARVNTLTEKLECFKNLEAFTKTIDSHYAFYLIKNCLFMPKLLYLLRTSPSFEHPEILKLFDRSLVSALERITNVHLDPHATTQALLPAKYGGLGIPSTEAISTSAYLSSLNASKPLARRILGANPLTGFEDRAKEQWLGKAPVNTPLPQSVKQADFTKPIFDRILADLRDSLAGVDLKRLECFTGPEQSSWLHALPATTVGLKLNDQQFRVAIATRLGSQVCERHTCRCGKHVEKDGLHGLSCKRSAGRISRHSHLNDILKRTLVSAGFASVLEPPGLCRADGKRPDGMTLIPWSRGQSLVWDVTVVDSLAPSRLTRNVSPTEEAEAKKIAKYTSISDSGYFFQPVAFDTQCRAGPKTGSFLKKLGKLLTDFTGEPRSHTFLMQRLQIAILQHNAACILGTIDESEALDEVYNIL
jgi:hypothetical protein